MSYIIVLMLMLDMCVNLIILRYVSKEQQPSFDVSDEYQKQLKSYRSIVRSNEKIIRELKKKEEKNDEKMAETNQQEDMVQTDRRIY